MAGLPARSLRTSLASTATGTILPAGDRFDARLLVAGARRTVRFADVLAAVGECYPGATILEIGPGRALAALVELAGMAAFSLSSGPGGTPDDVLAAVGELWVSGQPVPVARLCREGRRVRLPSYPFAGPPWLAPEAQPAARSGRGPAAAGPRPDDGTEAGDAPPTDVSEALARAWRDLLGEADLTGASDFFDLGGDSLTAVHLGRRLREELGVRVPLRALLAARTLDGQIDVIRDLVVSGM